MMSLKRGPDNSSPLRNVRIVTSSVDKAAGSQEQLHAPSMKVNYTKHKLNTDSSPENTFDMRAIEHIENIIQQNTSPLNVEEKPNLRLHVNA